MKRLLTLLSLSLFSIMIYAQKPYIIMQDGEEVAITAAQFKPFILPALQNLTQEMNKQLPKRVDDMTTATKAVMDSCVIKYDYRVDINKNDITQKDLSALSKEMIKLCKDQFQSFFASMSDTMPNEEWRRLFTELGIYYIFAYYDNQGEKLFLIHSYPDGRIEQMCIVQHHAIQILENGSLLIQKSLASLSLQGTFLLYPYLSSTGT